MTEQQILKKFEELGYEIEIYAKNNEIYLINEKVECKIVINKFEKTYYVRNFYTFECQMLLLQEHQLLHELFKCWGWLDE